MFLKDPIVISVIVCVISFSIMLGIFFGVKPKFVQKTGVSKQVDVSKTLIYSSLIGLFLGVLVLLILTGRKKATNLSFGEKTPESCGCSSNS